MTNSDKTHSSSSASTSDHEWISYDEAIACIWQALPEFVGNEEAARGALIRSLEDAKIKCRDQYGRELHPDDVRDSLLSYVNTYPYAFLGGIKGTRWWGVRDIFVAATSAAGTQ